MYTQALVANGAKVYITGRRLDVLEKTERIHGSPDNPNTPSGSIIPIVMDVTSKDSIREVANYIAQKEGYLNLLVNNAGIWTSKPDAGPQDGPEVFGKAMFEENIDDWQRGMYRPILPYSPL